ncbi:MULTISPECIES: SDR family oxidoreductase [Vibrio]|uniref:SDR family oxidoreductase n=1 Tax=Vibrio cortegadensis TaxID=1328770 RepID=A0ABV4M6D8_9VIBR|nr:SDR family oxidoreductase [Vibrio sp. 03-59-1]NOH85009.1 SDR family oxidoreductase [Vibrio sp. 03-59-1]RBW63682.1 short chain dehydrogenase [Vibrionales bacterium C3R12]
MDIENSIILVTSAGSRLGCTLATHFAKLGAKVALCDQDSISLMETYHHCLQISDHVAPFPIASSSEQSIHTLLDLIQNHFDAAPNVLVNCWTSSPMPKLTSNQPAKPFVEQLSEMASTLFSFGQVSAERMRLGGKKGVIVNVISHDNYHDFSGVESATSMVSGFTTSWAKELNPFNIRVGGVVPAIHHLSGKVDDQHWAEVQDELIRSTEYIVSNEYFSGRVVSAEV